MVTFPSTYVTPEQYFKQGETAEFYTYPDISVVCGKLAVGKHKLESFTNQVLIIEVLSPSTRDYDCRRKFTLYRAIPSLREYITVAQELPFLEQRTRQNDNSWISSIYSKVEFDA